MSRGRRNTLGLNKHFYLTLNTKRTFFFLIYYITLLSALIQLLANSKQYLRPLSSAVISQSQTLAAQNTTPVALLPQIRSFQTSPVTRDIDSAAKFIGAGAATVGVAGSGSYWFPHCSLNLSSCPLNPVNCPVLLPAMRLHHLQSVTI